MNTEEEDVIIPLLVRRSCHLPGNTWWQDWRMFFSNNHMLLGICLHHRLHPLGTWERVLNLLGSISFGLALTSIAYMWDNWAIDEDSLPYNQQFMEQPVFILPTFWNDSGGFYAITTGNLVLWTLGGVCHFLYDFFIWHIMACGCCHPGGRWGNNENSTKWRDCGSYAMIPVILGLTGFAAWAIWMRATESSGDGDTSDSDNPYDDQVQQDMDQEEQQQVDSSFQGIEDLQSFTFLAKYFVEVLLAWFVYFPVGGTIVFSGALGCNGRLPVLGGRPRDKRRVEDGSMLQSSRGDSTKHPYSRWQ